MTMSYAFHHLTGGHCMVPWARVTSADELMSSAIYRPADISLLSQHPRSQAPRTRDAWSSPAPYRDFKATAGECRLPRLQPSGYECRVYNLAPRLRNEKLHAMDQTS
jgi:hypothetical protein